LKPLPNYNDPPVVEVAVSLLIEPPDGLTSAHLGAFWTECRDRFPKLSTCQPIPRSIEEFPVGGDWYPRSLRLGLSDVPEVRAQMTSDDEQWLRQFQVDRVAVNWRRRSTPYPRYDAVLDAFRQAWYEWSEFVVRAGAAEPQPVQWEVAYVNRIPKGELWQTTSDWPSVLPRLLADIGPKAQDVRLTGMHGQWVWDHESRPARLVIEPRPIREGSAGDNDATLMLFCTARGALSTPDGSSSKWDNVKQGIDLGREMIVRQFDAIVSEAAQRAWGKQ